MRLFTLLLLCAAGGISALPYPQDDPASQQLPAAGGSGEPTQQGSGTGDTGTFQSNPREDAPSADGVPAADPNETPADAADVTGGTGHGGTNAGIPSTDSGEPVTDNQRHSGDHYQHSADGAEVAAGKSRGHQKSQSGDGSMDAGTGGITDSWTPNTGADGTTSGGTGRTPSTGSGDSANGGTGHTPSSGAGDIANGGSGYTPSTGGSGQTPSTGGSGYTPSTGTGGTTTGGTSPNRKAGLGTSSGGGQTTPQGAGAGTGSGSTPSTGSGANPKDSKTPSAGGGSSTGSADLEIVNQARAEWNPALASSPYKWSTTLYNNAKDTVETSGFNHKMNPGTSGQVLAKGNADLADAMKGWLCEIFKPGFCTEQTAGLGDNPQGHAEILSDTGNQFIGCFSDGDVYACDVGNEA